MTAPSNLKPIVSSLPEKPGVYKYFDKNAVIIYVGKAKSLKKRVLSYFTKNHHDNFKTALLVSKIQHIEYTVRKASFLESRRRQRTECFGACNLRRCPRIQRHATRNGSDECVLSPDFLLVPADALRRQPIPATCVGCWYESLHLLVSLTSGLFLNSGHSAFAYSQCVCGTPKDSQTTIRSLSSVG